MLRSVGGDMVGLLNSYGLMEISRGHQWQGQVVLVLCGFIGIIWNNHGDNNGTVSDLPLGNQTGQRKIPEK